MWKTFLLASRQGDQIGRIFSNSLGDYLRWAVFENCNSRLMNVLLFVQAESYRNLLPQTLHWAKIWAISSQTRLVTLLAVLENMSVALKERERKRFVTGLPDFYFSKHTKTIKINQMTTNFTKRL
jgi:hypothetical protein